VPLLIPDATAPIPVPAGPAVLLVDDCAAARDGPAEELLAGWTADRADLALVVAGRSDELTVTFRGLAAEVRAARCAVLLHPGPGDGELAGVRLPPRRAGGPPGRGLVIGDPAWGSPFGAAPVPVQVALPDAPTLPIPKPLPKPPRPSGQCMWG
jgi:S-DNA-T family DNA segregation ATPase FtsK/SpoIIIE